MYRLRYQDQLLDDLPEDTPITDLRTDKCIFAAFLGILPSMIDVEHIQSTEQFVELRASHCGHAGQ